MAGSSMELHEDASRLSEETIDRHRAIVSLMEELEAVDWYDQRVEATSNESLRNVLAHNRDEEKEHAAMNLEWLRRHDPGLDAELRTYLFTDKPITKVEEAAMGDDDANSSSANAGTPGTTSDATLGLGIGGLKGTDSL